jgi:hypothetical protein
MGWSCLIAPGRWLPARVGGPRGTRTHNPRSSGARTIGVSHASLERQYSRVAGVDLLTGHHQRSFGFRGVNGEQSRITRSHLSTGSRSRQTQGHRLSESRCRRNLNPALKARPTWTSKVGFPADGRRQEVDPRWEGCVVSLWACRPTSAPWAAKSAFTVDSGGATWPLGTHRTSLRCNGDLVRLGGEFRVDCPPHPCHSRAHGNEPCSVGADDNPSSHNFSSIWVGITGLPSHKPALSSRISARSGDYLSFLRRTDATIIQIMVIGIKTITRMIRSSGVPRPGAPGTAKYIRQPP